MSHLIANINGIDVFSDKEVSSIINSRVNFTDGSWCDVTTGEVVNRDRGYINIGTSVDTASTEKVTKGPLTYMTGSLELLRLSADVEVTVHDKAEMELTMVGPASEIDEISLSDDGQTLRLEGRGQSDNSGNTIVTNSSFISVGGSVSGRVVVSRGNFIQSGSINVGGSGFRNQTKITVKVPLNVSLRVDEVFGNSIIGDTEGDIRVSNSLGNVKIGKVANAQLSERGSGDISVDEVNGNVDINLVGSGDISIFRGIATMLNINLTGSGDVNFSGLAENAHLNLVGSGDIRVNKVTGNLSKNVMGSGDIVVNNR